MVRDKLQDHGRDQGLAKAAIAGRFHQLYLRHRAAVWVMLGILALAIFFKIQTLGSQPVSSYPDYRGGYRPYTLALAGKHHDPHLTYVYPAGYPYYLYLVWTIFGFDNEAIAAKVLSALSVGVPVALFLFFYLCRGGIVAPVVASLAYYLSTSTLRAEAMLASETLATLVIAVSLVLAALLHRWQHLRFRATLPLAAALGAMLFYLALVRPQFRLLFVVFGLAAVLSAAPLLVHRLFSARAHHENANTPDVFHPRRHWANWAVVLLVATAGYLGWCTRNYMVGGLFNFLPNTSLIYLNAAIPFLETVEPENEAQAGIQRKILELRAIHGSAGLLAANETRIRESLSISHRTLQVEGGKLGQRALAKNRGDYARQGLENFLQFFGQRVGGAVGHPYLEDRVASLWPWKVVSKGLGFLRPNEHPLRHTGSALFFAGLLTLLYWRHPSVMFAVLLPLGAVLYAALTVAMVPNSETPRYRSTTEWLWIGYLLWAPLFLVESLIAKWRRKKGRSPTPEPGQLSLEPTS